MAMESRGGYFQLGVPPSASPSIEHSLTYVLTRVAPSPARRQPWQPKLRTCHGRCELPELILASGQVRGNACKNQFGQFTASVASSQLGLPGLTPCW